MTRDMTSFVSVQALQHPWLVMAEGGEDLEECSLDWDSDGNELYAVSAQRALLRCAMLHRALRVSVNVLRASPSIVHLFLIPKDLRSMCMAA